MLNLVACCKSSDLKFSMNGLNPFVKAPATPVAWRHGENGSCWQILRQGSLQMNGLEK